MWLNELYKRWMGRSPRRIRRRFSLPRTIIRPRLEKLEDRTLLSAPAPYVFTAGGSTTVSATQGQFGPGGTVSSTGFSGIQNKSWNPSGGSISTGPLGNKWGAQGFLNLNVNQLGVSYYASASGGNVTSTYNNVTLQQNYGNDPTAFGQQISFTPQNTNVSYGGGSVNTSAPSLSAGVNLELNMDGSVGGTAAGFGGSVSGSAPFSLNVDPSLLNVTFGNSNGSGGLTNLSIVGLNLANTLNYVVSGASFADFQQQLSEEPPYFIAGQAQATTNPIGLQYVLSTGLGEVDPGEKLATKKGGGGFASGGQVVSSLATISLTAPEIASSGNNLQGGGVVNATSEGQILNMSLTPGAVLGLGNDNFSVGALSITFTLFNYTISESLDVQQSATVTPVNTLTYNFFQTATAPSTISATPTSGGSLTAGTYFYQVTSTTADGESTPSTEVSATTNANGAVNLTWAQATGATGYNIYRSTSSGEEVLLASVSGGGNVSFTDTGAAAVNPNQFTPTSNTAITTIPMSVLVSKNGGGAVSESSVQFNPGEDTVGVNFNGAPIGVVPTWNLALQFQNQLELVADTTQQLTVGQVYASLAGNQLFNLGPVYSLPSDLTNLAQVPIAQIANENFNIYSHSQTLPGFVIGGAFRTSLAVTSTADSNTEGSGSLRFAVNSADIDGVKTPQTITLGPGTYNLTLGSGTGGPGSYGALYINAPGSLLIQGAGSGQTIINASGLGAGAFDAASGANLTLDGVTVEGANNGEAAILNSGSMTISDSSISNNSVGAIENDGSMTISDSGISDNKGEGGIFNDGTLTIANSTISNNTKTGNSDIGGGGIVTVSNSALTIIDSTIAANSSHTHGGGIAIDGGTATIINSTISGNEAVFDGGGLEARGSVTLYNTIVAGNTSSDGNNDVFGSVSSLSAGNLIGDGTGLSGISNGSNGNQIGTQSQPIAPLLSPLGNYGGPTQTMELLTGSPALNAGTTTVPVGLPLTDQRGFARTLNAKVDIGAVQYQYDLDLIGYLAAGGAPGKVQYHYIVTNNGLDPVEGATLTVTLPAGISYSSATVPAGWTETNPGNGTVTFTDSGSLISGQSASFTIAASVVNTTVGASFITTASVGPITADDNLSNNFVNLTVTNEQAGQSFNANLYSFTGGAANATAGSFTGSVYWGQNDSTSATGFGGNGASWQTNSFGTNNTIQNFGGNGTGWQENQSYIGTVNPFNSTEISSDTLTLTDGGSDEYRSAFYNTALSLPGNFTASFTYTATSTTGTPGGGASFVLAGSPTDLGVFGGGFVGMPSPSLAVEIAAEYPGNSTGVGIATNGGFATIQSLSSVNLQNSDPKTISITYDAAAQTLTVVVTDKKTAASDNVVFDNVNLGSIFNGSDAYVGFSGGDYLTTSGLVSTQTIGNFSFNYEPVSTTPATPSNVLTLTQGSFDEAHSYFNTTPVSTGDFTTSFTYTATSSGFPNNAANGFTFVLAGSSTALGLDGSGLGYQGNFGPSLAVAFSIYQPSGVGVQLGENGSFITPIQSLGSVDLDNSDPKNITLKYDAAAQTLTVDVTDPLADTSASYVFDHVNLGSIFNGSDAYVGFTGGDGAAVSTQQISNFNFASTLPVPSNVAATVSGSGSLNGTFYYEVTSTNSNGESPPSTEVSASPNDQSVQLSWSQVLGATGYKIYRGTASGQENTLVATITGSNTSSFTDTGSHTTSIALPPTITFENFNSSTQVGSTTDNTSVQIVHSGGSFGAGDFPPADWQTNQNNANFNSTALNGILTLTDGNSNEARSAFYTTPVNTLGNSFQVEFGYTATSSGFPNDAANGLGFVLQTAGPGALGNEGDGLGYQGISGPSLAVLFNIYAPNGVGVALGIDGNQYTSYQPLSPFSPNAINASVLNNNDPKTIFLDYNSAAQTMTVEVADSFAGGAIGVVSFNDVNLSSIFHGSDAYLGFTGSDGAAVSTQQIGAFGFSSSNSYFSVNSTYTYTEAGDFAPNIQVTGLDGTNGASNAQQLFNVISAPLTSVSVTPPANAAIGQPIATFKDVLLYHFADTKTPSATAGDFTATINWGDNSSNTSDDGSGTVSIVADATGGFDVLGSHNYTAVGSYEVTASVSGSDGTSYSNDPPFQFGATLFHFTDANPNATASDYVATVNWGDGTSNSSSDGTGTVSIVADSAGGFDVIGSHTYTQKINLATFSVQVGEVGGASTGASDTHFQVLYPDQPLTAGNLSVPSVTTEGQSISNQLLFQFTDPDSDAQASDYLATVVWGDGTFNSSNDGSATVSVVADPSGGGEFDVLGSHTYVPGSGYFQVKVTDEGDPRSSQPDLGGQIIGGSTATPLIITALPVTLTSGSAFTASENSLSSVQTVAAFTDPGGAEFSYIPGVIAPTVSSNGGSLAAGTYYYTVTGATPQGESTPSNQVSATTTGSTSTVTLTWFAAPGATGYKVYRGTSPGAENTLIATITSATTLSFTDDGTETTSSASPPTIDTASGHPEADPNPYVATVQWGDGSVTEATLNSQTNYGPASLSSSYVPVVNAPTVSSSGGSLAAGTYYYTVTSKAASGQSTISNEVSATTTGSFSAITLSWGQVAGATGYNIYRGTAPGAEDILVASITNGTTLSFTDDGTVSNNFVVKPQLIIGHPYVSSSSTPGIVLGSDGQTFSINLAHEYIEDGQTAYTITTTLNHEGVLSQTTTPASVANPAVDVTAGPTFSAQEGITSSVQTVATFTDPAGGEYFVPRQNAPTVSKSGGTLAAGTYSYAVTSTTAFGESTASNEVSATTTGNSSSVQLNWNQVADATGYKIYRGTSPGAEDTLIGTLLGASSLNYSDTGSEATSAASPPTDTSADYPTSDPDPYMANVQWGDGTSSTATLANGGIVLGSDGQTFSVNLAHQYAGAGAYDITTTLNHDGVLSPPVTTTADVAGITVTAAGPFTTSYGTALSNVTLATFTETFASNSASDYSATINWGDKQTSSGSIGGSNGNFTVTASHTYAAVGSYPISITVSLKSDSTFTSSDSTKATVNPAQISYTISNDKQTYGSPANLAADLPLSITTGINGETLDITYRSSGDTNMATVGNYAINGIVGNGTGLASNYSVTLTPGTLTVNPAQISYTIGIDSQTYGSPANLAADLPSSFTTGINGETLEITYSSAGDTPTANAGNYAITGTLSNGTGLLSNYIVTLNSGALTVNPYAISYTIGNDTQAYGHPANLAADLPSNLNTGINGETLDITYSSTGDTATANAMSYAITGTLSNGTGLLSNYIVTLNSGTLTVNPYAISYTIGNDTQAYGHPANLAADLGNTIASGVNGETLEITYSSAGDTPTANAGNYAITGTLSNGTGLLSNYIVTLNSGALTVNPYAISYTIGNDTQAYGHPANLAADLPSNLNTGINGETLDITYSSSGNTKTAAVGAYAISGTVSNGTGLASNYNVTLTNGTLTISTAKISYAIGNASQSYGSPANLAADLPSSFQTGINGETLDIAYSSTGDVNTAVVGNYAITGTMHNGTGQTANYTVTLKDGTLTIKPSATQTQLTGMSILPNPLNGTAAVTLTMQVTNPQTDVNEGEVSAHLAGQTANGTVLNGQASVQLTVPLSSVTANQSISLGYADNGSPANFEPSSATTTVSLGLLNALIPTNLSLTSSAVELDAIPLLFGILDLFFTNQQLTEVRFGPLDLHIQYFDVGNLVLVTINGIPWQVDVFGPQGQFLGAISLVPTVATTQ